MRKLRWIARDWLSCAWGACVAVALVLACLVVIPFGTLYYWLRWLAAGKPGPYRSPYHLPPPTCGEGDLKHWLERD